MINQRVSVATSDEPVDAVLAHAATVIAKSEIVRLLFLEEESGLDADARLELESLLLRFGSARNGPNDAMAPR
jgi:hypothetical protein